MDTLQEVAAALPIVEELGVDAAKIFAPEVLPFLAPFAPAIPVIIRAVDVVAKDTGKPFDETFTDVINTLIRGMPSAPALAEFPPTRGVAAAPAAE